MNTDQRFDRQFLEQTCGSFSEILSERWRRTFNACDEAFREKELTWTQPTKFFDAR